MAIPAPPSTLRRTLQRLFVAAALAILAAPMLVHALLPAEQRRGENRAPAPLPAPPASLAALPAWTTATDAWLRDHFGLRNRYLDVQDQLLFRLFGTFASPQILPGREGRLFLASHAAGEPYRNSLLRTSCGIAVPPERRQQIAQSLAEVLARTDTVHPGPTLAILVPSAAALYPAQLPPWLERQCRAATPLLAGIVEAVPAPLRPRAINLLPVLAALDPATPAIPPHNFHWDGAGPLRAAAWIAETQFHRQPAFALPTRTLRKRSDITGFFPGLRIMGDVVQAEETRAGVATCIGPDCFTASLGPETARLLADLRRHESPAPQGRLLLLTDSFGAFASAGFTPYFREVVQVSLNNLPQLSPPQRARLRQALIEEYRPDATLFLFHDWATTYIWTILLRDLLGPEATP